MMLNRGSLNSFLSAPRFETASTPGRMNGVKSESFVSDSTGGSVAAATCGGEASAVAWPVTCACERAVRGVAGSRAGVRDGYAIGFRRIGGLVGAIARQSKLALRPPPERERLRLNGVDWPRPVAAHSCPPPRSSRGVPSRASGSLRLNLRRGAGV